MIDVCVQKKTWKQAILVSFQIVGIVYGQLSTAPLYVFGTMQVEDLESEEVVYELFSFIFWTLTTICLIKYALIVLQADDKGEGMYVSIYLSIISLYQFNWIMVELTN